MGELAPPDAPTDPARSDEERRVFGLGISLALLSQTPAAGGVALVYSPTIELHRALVERFHQRDPSVVVVAVDDPWPHPHAPRAAIALGRTAMERTRQDWPSIPHALLLQWESTTSPTHRPELWGGLRAAPGCTAELLERTHGESGWLVLAGDADTEALALAHELDAVLVAGDVAAQHRAVLSGKFRRIWLRAEPRHAEAPEWLAWLAGLGRAEHWFVGSDMPALAHLGFADPIALDLDGMASDTLSWLHATRRRPQRGRTPLEVRCRKP